MISWMFEVEDVACLVDGVACLVGDVASPADDTEKMLELGDRARRGIVHPNNISRMFPQISLISSHLRLMSYELFLPSSNKALHLLFGC